MTGDLAALYERTVLDHSRHPRHHGRLDGAAFDERHNPLCGDRVTVYVRSAGGVVQEVCFEASACAIVVASSSLMTEAVAGLGHADIVALAERVRRMLVEPAPHVLDDLGPLAALAGVRQFPLRVRCAWLPWQALEGALARAPR